MKLKFFFRILQAVVFLLCLINPDLSAQTKAGGVSLANNLTVNNSQLVLNGVGVRAKYFMDMYAAGLYLSEKSKDAQQIINADKSMVIRIHIVSGLITSRKMEEAINEGFKNSTKGNTAPYKSQITEFMSAFKEEIKQNDIFDIVYSENKITVLKNNAVKATIHGLEFKKALFGIWLSDKPADENLKKAMLGLK